MGFSPGLCMATTDQNQLLYNFVIVILAMFFSFTVIFLVSVCST